MLCDSGSNTADRYGPSRLHDVSHSSYILVVLDTDHLSVLERHEQPSATSLRARLALLPPEEVVTTIISYEEQVRGWMTYLARTQSVAQQVEAYRRLLQPLDSYRRIPVLGFDEATAVVFQRLRRAHRWIGAMDVKIAAIVLSQNATLLSRHLADFRQIPDLRVEDWIAS